MTVPNRQALPLARLAPHLTRAHGVAPRTPRLAGRWPREPRSEGDAMDKTKRFHTWYWVAAILGILAIQYFAGTARQMGIEVEA